MQRGWCGFTATYLLVMATPGLATLVAGIGGGTPLHGQDVLLEVIVAMVVVAVTAGWLLARPLRSSEAAERWDAAADVRLTSLPKLSAVVIGPLVAMLMGRHHLQEHAVAASGASPHYPLALILVYAVLTALFVYFSVSALAVRYRLRQGHGIRHTRRHVGSLRSRLLIAISLTASVPMALSLTHRRLAEQAPNWHAGAVDSLVVFDLIAALLLTAAAVAYVTQSLSRPVEELLVSMRRLQGGDLRAEAVVVTDDEVGALALAFNDMADSLRERAFLRETLGRFVPEAVAAAVLADRGVIQPKVQEATVLFTDVAGFTGMCENLPPGEIIGLLNEYFGVIAEPVQRNGGIIVQFQGDAMVASFNLPATDADHALSALLTAVEIQTILAERRFVGGRVLHTRVGVSTGLMVGGTVGGDTRVGYTLHGDAVNLAQRLEEANKREGTQILLSSRTAELVGERHPLVEVGEIDLPGRRMTERVFSVVSRAPAPLARPRQRDCPSDVARSSAARRTGEPLLG